MLLCLLFDAREALIYRSRNQDFCRLLFFFNGHSEGLSPFDRSGFSDRTSAVYNNIRRICKLHTSLRLA